MAAVTLTVTLTVTSPPAMTNIDTSKIEYRYIENRISIYRKNRISIYRKNRISIYRKNRISIYYSNITFISLLLSINKKYLIVFVIKLAEHDMKIYYSRMPTNYVT